MSGVEIQQGSRNQGPELVRQQLPWKSQCDWVDRTRWTIASMSRPVKLPQRQVRVWSSCCHIWDGMYTFFGTFTLTRADSGWLSTSQYQASAHGGTKGSQRDPIFQAPWALKRTGIPAVVAAFWLKKINQTMSKPQVIFLSHFAISCANNGMFCVHHFCQWSALLSLSSISMTRSKTISVVFYSRSRSSIPEI